MDEKPMTKKRIDLGCGTIERRRYNHTENYIGVDYGNFGQEIKHDLTKFPYPFKTDSVDVIFSSHCIENLIKDYRELKPILREMYRISKNGANWVLIFPHWTRAFNDPLHNIGIGVDFLKHFQKTGSSHGADVDNYDNIDITVEKVTYKWRRLGNKGWDKWIGLFDKIWSFILNINITLTEHLLIYKFGGIQEFRIEVKVRK